MLQFLGETVLLTFGLLFDFERLIVALVIFFGALGLVALTNRSAPATSRLLFCILAAIPAGVAGCVGFGLLGGFLGVAISRDGFAGVGAAIMAGIIGLTAGASYGFFSTWRRTAP